MNSRMMGRKTISIVGLGWLGLPLAKSLLQKGYKVKGSVTSSEKMQEIDANGIEVSVVNILQNELCVSDNDFFSTDVLIINIPPKRISDIDIVFPSMIQQLIPSIIEAKIEKVIFISSTSVYPETNGYVFENKGYYPDKVSGRACLNAEYALRTTKQFNTTVIRFGGLIGADRNPHRFMKAGEKNGFGKIPVNLIHLSDCIEIIEHIIANNFWNEVINASSPKHPTREAFYTLAAKVAGVEAPLFDDSLDFKFKKVSSKKLTNSLKYKFKYKSPLEYLIEINQSK